jgi:hypothetical protein
MYNNGIQKIGIKKSKEKFRDSFDSTFFKIIISMLPLAYCPFL